MTTETKFRGGLAMSLLGLTIMTFFYFQQQDELQRCKASDSFLQGGDIEKSRLKEQKDSLEVELNVQNMMLSELSYNWDILREINPSLADSIDNQTE
jgi:hypothetical protein